MPDPKRQLAAIMFTDIVGYTKLMGEDESKALALLRKNRNLHKSIIKKHQGTWLKEMGDGTLASFKTTSDAVYCAGELMKACVDDRISLRIGIHQGEVTMEDGDIFGDGVNVASRIEPLAEPGQILVSEPIHQNVKNKERITSTYQREVELKNVGDPVRVYQVHVTVDATDTELSATSKKSIRKPIIVATVLALAIMIIYSLANYMDIELPSDSEIEDKSIAVLPFSNMSADEQNQYFADGQMEAILNHLTKIADLRVISRTTMMGYRESPKSIPEIADELGVRYVLEGSVQKAGEKVRVTAQLIDSGSDEHLWSENYDRDLADIFGIQTEIAKRVVKELEATITSREQASIEVVPTSDLTAYDFYLKGLDFESRSNSDDNLRYALQMYERAVKLDPDFTLAWVGLASSSRSIYWFYHDRSPTRLEKTKAYLDKAIALDPDLVEVQIETGRYYYQCQLNYPKALEILEKLLVTYPKNDQLQFWTGAVYRRMGQFEKALEFMDRAIKLNPSEWNHWQDAAGTLIFLKKYKQSESYYKTAIDLNPSFWITYRFLYRVYLITGELKKAGEMIYSHSQQFSELDDLRANQEVMNRNYDRAISIIDSASEATIDGQFGYAPKSMRLGLIYRMMLNEKLASSYFQKARKMLEDKLNESPDDYRVYSSLGIVYAGLGMRKEALEMGNKALSMMNINVDAMRGFRQELNMVQILLMVGDLDQAIAKLEFLLQKNGTISVELLKLDPFWDPLREMEGFKALINNPAYQINL